MEKRKTKKTTTKNKSKKAPKRKGFTLIEVLAVIIIIGIIAIIAVPMVSNYIEGASTTTYKSYEKSMEDSAKNKMIDCIDGKEGCINLDKGDIEKVYLYELIDGGYIDNMKDPDSNEMCRTDLSYVLVERDYSDTYKYDVCLYCGEYQSENSVCTKATSDGDNPECGEISGNSTRWTNQDRNITVKCSDNTSGCTKGMFSKVFKTTTEKGEITISDKSGNTTVCGNIDVYVDKTPPTCEIEVKSGDCVDWLVENETCNIYGNNVKVGIKNQTDLHSGILTYGMGTSILNRDYNKNDEMSLQTGITTVIGYVKDQAGNEGICTKDIKVATTPTVTLNSNGGTSCSPSSKTVVYGGTYGNLCTPTRSGYTFNGWYTLSSGGDKIESTTRVARPTNHTLYAHWTGNTCTVTTNANGGSIPETNGWTGSGTTASKTVTITSTYGTLPTPTQTGYTFNGWYTEEAGGDKVESTTIVTRSTDHTLFAHWTRQYTVSYDCNGGSGTAPASVTVSSGTMANISVLSCGNKIVAGSGSGTSATPSVYYQTGWALTNSGSASSSVEVTNDILLYATWGKVFTYSGNYQVIDDGNGDYRIAMRGSGTFTSILGMDVDIFVVGGGGGGGTGNGGGGGGSGYTNTVGGQILDAGNTYSVTVGAGGAAQTAGGQSKFGSLASANGGSGGNGTKGGNGGSGGGTGGASNSVTHQPGNCSPNAVGGGAGGTNGAAGSKNAKGTSNYGTGQGSTTCAFGKGIYGGSCDSGVTMYAKGGNGGNGKKVWEDFNENCSLSTSASNGSAGTANSGNGGNGGNAGGTGGAGGTGMVILKNNKSIVHNGRVLGRYTGTYEVVDDGGNNYRIRFLSTGVFTPAMNINADIFVVGGGGGGGSNGSAGGGGGAGFTNTVTNYSFVQGTNYNITIGAGGAAQTAGGQSKIVQGSTTIASANGGAGGNGIAGGNGGSGGGAGGSSNDLTHAEPTGSTCSPTNWHGGAGGTNGKAGSKSGNNGTSYGTGQGTTTCEFGQGTYGGSCNSGVPLYASGGTGGEGRHVWEDFNNHCSMTTSSSDGANGLGNTGNGGAGGNVGGAGGTGGSGILIVRNTR